MEYLAPATVLPLSRLTFNSRARQGQIFFPFWVNMVALRHMTRNVKFLNTMRRLWPRSSFIQIDYLLQAYGSSR
jgi:hypothetical protein